MSQNDNHTSHISLLQRHRALVIQQIADLQETLKGINSLLAPSGNSASFSIDDKVVSLSAPNKNKIGLVTKVTEAFIHVAPLNLKYSAYKKAHKNLIHYRDINQQSTELTIYTPDFGKIVSSSPASIEIAVSPPKLKQGRASYSHSRSESPPVELHLESCILRTKTTTSSTTTSKSSSNSSHRYTTRSLRTKRKANDSPNDSPIESKYPRLHRTTKSPSRPSSPPIKAASLSPDTPSPNTARQIRIQYHIDRGLHHPIGQPKPTKRITQATIKRRLKKTETLRLKKLSLKDQKQSSYTSPTRKLTHPSQQQQLTSNAISRGKSSRPTQATHSPIDTQDSSTSSSHSDKTARRRNKCTQIKGIRKGSCS